MAVFYSCDHLPGFRHAVITIGAFDGVHHGHLIILKKVVQQAASIGGESVVITFDPHPRKLLYPAESLKLLTPLDQKLSLLAAAGIDHIVVVSFTRAFSEMSAAEYIRDFLVRHFHPSCIVTGYDHHFGHDRTGDIQLLREMQGLYGFEVQEIPAQWIREAAVSSSKIRQALSEGNVSAAAQMLGRFYELAGVVVAGRKLGHTIGFPTANLSPAIPDQLIPATGVYAVKVLLDSGIFDGMLNIGYRPTIAGGDSARHIEVHILDFSGDIYGRPLTVRFIEKMREELRFPSVEALKEQLHRDRSRAREILSAG